MKELATKAAQKGPMSNFRSYFSHYLKYLTGAVVLGGGGIKKSGKK